MVPTNLYRYLLENTYFGQFFYFSNDLSILAGACVFNCVEDSRDTCEGFTEFFCEGEDQPIFKVTQEISNGTTAAAV